MLILTRKPGESLYIGDNVKITIVEIKGHQIRVGIDAPPELRIYREEIYLQILEENKKAAEAAVGPNDAGLEGLSSAWAGRKQGLGAGAGPKGFGKGKIAGLENPKPQTNKPEVVIRRKGKSGDEGAE